MKNVCLQTTAKALTVLAFALTMSIASFAQKITVTGTVYEPEGEPAIGASVVVEGQTQGVVTDFGSAAKPG